MKRTSILLTVVIMLLTLLCSCQNAWDSTQQSIASLSSPTETNPNDPVSLPYDSVFPEHEPYGKGVGAMPGRVVWAHNPDSVKWDDEGYWWKIEHFNESAVQAMVDESIASLGGKDTVREGWDALFTVHNTARKKSGGYVSGEKIAIKANINGSAVFDDDISGETQLGYTNPVLLKTVLISLVKEAGVAPSDITVYDVSRLFPDYMVEMCTSGVLHGVNFIGRNNSVADESAPINWSYAFSGAVNYLPTCVTEAEYVVNLANLKGHSYGITLCGKNHFGSFINGNIMRPPEGANLHQFLTRNEMDTYSPLTDLTANYQLGEKTVLYMLDALICATTESDFITGDNSKWQQAPFNGHYTSSVFVSQDPVAIDSVGADFLINEPAVTERNAALRDNPNVENYLHETALVSNPPSGMVYLNGSDETVKNLGVHEHWNNSTDKQYSRNLGKDEGIELVYIKASVTAETEKTDKTLIAYFSRAGNTETVAEHIQKLTGGDLFEIRTAKPYPDNYSACQTQASEELAADFRPELSTHVNGMDDYDVVFVGFPIWHGNTPMAIRSFLEEYDFSGKTVIPFCTSGGSGISQSVSAIRRICSTSDVLDGLCINDSSLNQAYELVEEWIGGLDIKASNLSAPEPASEPQPPTEPSANGSRESDTMTTITITVGDSVFSAELYDNSAARSLLAQFPITLNMSDMNGNEKYFYLTHDLPSESTESPVTINAGDLMCWSGNCLVLFYKAFSNSYGGYVRLGYVEDASGLADALGNGSVQITFAAEN